MIIYFHYDHIFPNLHNKLCGFCSGSAEADLDENVFPGINAEVVMRSRMRTECDRDMEHAQVSLDVWDVYCWNCHRRHHRGIETHFSLPVKSLTGPERSTRTLVSGIQVGCSPFLCSILRLHDLLFICDTLFAPCLPPVIQHQLVQRPRFIQYHPFCHPFSHSTENHKGLRWLSAPQPLSLNSGQIPGADVTRGKTFAKLFSLQKCFLRGQTGSFGFGRLYMSF